jgi:uncharacterized cupin superfamily protein
MLGLERTPAAKSGRVAPRRAPQIASRPRPLLLAAAAGPSTPSSSSSSSSSSSPAAPPQNAIVVRPPTDAERRAASAWPTWGCGADTFPWTYDARETCLLLSGEVVVTPDDRAAFGGPVRVSTGDYAVFPAGMSCTWAVSAPIKKHYRFG